MADRRWRAALCSAVLCVTASEAAAQTAARASGSVEVTTDHRRRGISWSDGKVALDAIATLPVTGALRVEARATTLRGSPRHAGADLGLDGSAAYVADLGGGLTVTGGVTGHFFPGERETSYGEIDAVLGYAIGPAQIEGFAHYAPPQDSIGGDNLYLGARVGGSIPATPYSILAHVGRTTGGTDDFVRAARLRPDGDYTDWGVRVERTVGNVAIGVRYSGTDIADEVAAASPFANREDAGDRLTAHIALFF
ncbi:TorF family putative porin [Sphingomonas baiyangensis]|uniref:Porin n=1 Tax=Sphingomonas baiyangensis TaxID=2572576 RepID=A0A4U1L9A6_9SPHN|nr:TorF family putative porin [Sphingomonas baiyangensis]TKD53005.1 hypothetical protein FBR43_01275 [Sphingomonas baiyangensis]